MTPRPLRVLVADDEAHVRQGLRMRLGLEPDLEVVGTVAAAGDVVDAARRTAPDVLLLDVRMPPHDGLATVPRLRRALPTLHIVVLSLHDDRATRVRAIAAGVDAFVGKSAGDATLLAAIRAAAVGNASTDGSDLRRTPGPDDRRTAPLRLVRSVAASRRGRPR